MMHEKTCDRAGRFVRDIRRNAGTNLAHRSATRPAYGRPPLPEGKKPRDRSRGF